MPPLPPPLFQCTLIELSTTISLKPVGSYFSNIVKVSKNTLSALLMCEIFPGGKAPRPLKHLLCFNFHFSHSITNVGLPIL